MNWILIGSIVGGLAVVIIILLILFARAQYKYIFKIYSRDLKYVFKKKARIVTKPTDKRVKKFQLQGSNDFIDLHDPTSYEDSKPVRDITQDHGGSYVYIEKSILDDKLYRTSSVEPVERSLIISQLIDNQKKNPQTDKSGLIAQISWIVLAAIALIGVIFVITKFAKMADILIDLSESQVEVSANALKIEQLRLEYQDTTTITNDGSIIRSLESDNNAATSSS